MDYFLKTPFISMSEIEIHLELLTATGLCLCADHEHCCWNNN